MTVVAESNDIDGAAERAPMPVDEIGRILDEDAAEPRFDGVIHGWRIAPDDVLDAEGIRDRNLVRSCQTTPAGEETRTELDFELTYLPPMVRVGNVSGPSKWVCDGEGLSVAYDYSVNTPYGSGTIWVERSIRGQKSLGLMVPERAVEPGSINGKQAIFIHPADDASGLGIGRIVVIEDGTDPEYTILRVTGDNGVPFSELIKVAEGIE